MLEELKKNPVKTRAARRSRTTTSRERRSRPKGKEVCFCSKQESAMIDSCSFHDYGPVSR